MKKLLTISAVVFLMVFTAGLATAKKPPVLTFPFTGTGDLFTVTTGGTAGGPISATITVDRIDGLYYGTIVTVSPAMTINFTAVQDLNGAYSLNGVVEGTTPANIAVQGGFVISYQKVPGLKTKAFAASIEFGTLVTSTAGPTVSAGESFAGVLFE